MLPCPPLTATPRAATSPPSWPSPPSTASTSMAGTALGEATEERWDEVLLQQGKVLVLVRTARHHGLPSPPGQEMQGALFAQWTPGWRHS